MYYVMDDFAYEERNAREAVRNADGTPGSRAGEQPKTLLALPMPVRERDRCGGVAFKKRTYKELRMLPQNGAEKAGPGFDGFTFRAASGPGGGPG